MKNRGSLCIAYEDLELVGGDWMTAALLSWFKRCQHKHPDGFTVTLKTVEDRLMLSRFQFERARGVLCQLGLLEIERVGFPAKLQYRLTEKALNTGCDKLATNSLSVSQHVRNSQPTNEAKETTFGTQESTIIQDATNSQPVPSTVCQETRNQYLILSDKEKKEGAKESAEQPYVQSSEDRFAEEMRQRSNGTYTPPFSPEKSEQLHHLRQTIGTQNANHRQVKDNWQRWYREFSREFIETAWQLSKSVAKRTGKKRLWTFIDLFEDYGQYPQLKSYVESEANLNNVPRLQKISRADELYSEGEQVIFEGEVHTVFSADEVFLELRNAKNEPVFNIFPRFVKPAHAALAGD